LQYYQWPRIGVGSHSYTDNYGSTKGPHSVHFDQEYYNWTKVLDKYNKVPSTSSQRAELGKLAYHCAVSVDMDFEYNGSTSNINRIPNAANKYFRYTAQHIKKSASGFWEQVDTNIVNGFPVQFAIYTSSGAGHAIVCDGLRPDDPNDLYYHLNMGWWGASNAWYLIQESFNAGGYSNITAAVIDMFPVPELDNPDLNIDDETLDLVWYYPTKVLAEAYELQVKEGPSNWVTIDNQLKATSYSYKYSNTDTHRFRVRAKMNGKWNALGWSNNIIVNIQQEINKQKPNELKAYPSLVTGRTGNKLTIEYKDLGNCDITIYNTNGVKVFDELKSGDASLSKKVISLAYLATGIYIVQVLGEEVNESIKIFKD